MCFLQTVSLVFHLITFDCSDSSVHEVLITMATEIDSMPPPSYAQVTGGVDQAFPLSYVDFVPALIKPGGLITPPTYERFG